MPFKARRSLTELVIVVLVTAPAVWADQVPVSASANRNTGASISADTGQIHLLVGRSAVLDVESPITRVSLTTPDVADAMVTAPHQLLIHGKAPGTISLFVWDRSGGIRTYEVIVKRDLSGLAERLQQLFPGEPINVAATGKDVVVSGTVSSKYVVEKAADVASGYVEKKENVVNLLRQQEGVASNQIMLRVRFAEVSRSALQELGASYFTGITGHKDYLGRATTQQFAAPDFDADKGLVFSDFLNLFVFNLKENLGAVVRALQTRGLFQSLAEPNLIAQNGKEASFLAGGEFPYPVVQGAGGLNTAITIQFKEFGVRLNFTPTILADDLIHLKVRPEVSALDFTNAVTIEGFRIPALSTRRTETEIELRDGQTFAIAGLLNNTLTSSISRVPGIGDIPILGLLFRSRAYQKAETELVVMITPHVVRRDSTGVAGGLPTIVEPFLNPPSRRIEPPTPYVGAPKYSRAAQSGSTGNPPAAATPPVVQTPASPAPLSNGGLTSSSDGTSSSASGRDKAQVKPQLGAVSIPPAVQSPQATARAAKDAASGAPTAVSATAPPPAARPLTKAEKQALRQAEEARLKKEKKDAEERLKKEKRDAEAARQKAKLAAEQARRDAERAKQVEKAAREKAERDARDDKKREAEARKRGEALAKAEAELRDAQAVYQATLDGLKKSDTTKSSNAQPRR